MNEWGMCLAYFYEDAENPTMIVSFKNLTKEDSIPKEVLNEISYGEDVEDTLLEDGKISWWVGDLRYLYTEYYNNHIYF